VISKKRLVVEPALFCFNEEMKKVVKKRVADLLKELKKLYPSSTIALKYNNNIQLLVAVILSAQCTDKKVNEVTFKLFKKYKTADDFASAKIKIFEKEIKSSGFYHAKAKNIVSAAKIIKRDFGGKLPRTMSEMLRLPGVARKTANVVLGNAYGAVEGIAVDTHVRKFAQRCRLSKHDDPNKIEQDLMKLIPKKDWFGVTYRIIDHGRSFYADKNQHKESCAICKLCPDFSK
jgi:endonuclease III